MMKADRGHEDGLRLNSLKGALSHQDPQVAVIESGVF
jgi:hypothetical protein